MSNGKYFGLNKALYIITAEIDEDLGYQTGDLTYTKFYGRLIKYQKRIIDRGTMSEIQTNYQIYTEQTGIIVGMKIGLSTTDTGYEVLSVDTKSDLDAVDKLYIITI